MRSSSPMFSDILSLIALEYDDLIFASCSENLLNYKGSITEFEDGACCMVGGRPFNEELLEAAEGTKAIIAWGFMCIFWLCTSGLSKSYKIIFCRYHHQK